MKRLAYLTLALAAILINGCSNEGLESAKLKVDESKKSLEFIILEDEALEAATDFLNGGNVEARSASSAEVKTIWRHITLSDDVSSRSATENETVEVPVYVVSFSDENGNPDGYVVTVGDKRVINRVLVFSEEGTWGLSEIPEFENVFWEGVDKSLTRTLTTSSVDPCDTYEYEEIGYIDKYAVDLFLTWGQTPAPYNDSLPACNATSNKPAGCIAVAMGQIMAHHKYPNSGSYIHQQYNRAVSVSYDWNKIRAASDASLLPLAEGRSGVANILAEIGYRIGMNYGCTVSTSSSSKVKGVFNSMGYNSSELSDFNLQTIIDNIDDELPVYIRGAKSGSSVGHAWTIEGYRQKVNNLIYGRDCPDGSGESIPPTIIEYSVLSHYLYFNLGWNGMYNGFYSGEIFSDWHYPNGPEIIYDIYPN